MFSFENEVVEAEQFSASHAERNVELASYLVTDTYLITCAIL